MAEIPYNFDSNIKHTEHKSWWSNTGIYLLGTALILLFITLYFLIKKLYVSDTPFVVLTEQFVPLPKMVNIWVNDGDTVLYGQYIGSKESISYDEFQTVEKLVLSSNPPKNIQLGSFSFTFSKPKNKPRKPDMYTAVLDGKVSTLRAQLRNGVDPNASQRIHQDIYDLLVKKERYLDRSSHSKSNNIWDAQQIAKLRKAFDTWKQQNLIKAKEGGVVVANDSALVYKPLRDTPKVQVICQNYCEELEAGAYVVVDKTTRKIVGKAILDDSGVATLQFKDPSYPLSSLDFERP